MKVFVGCAIIVVASVFATASAEADAGFFIPKAFYTLDAEGHKTQPHPVSPHTAQYLHRLRRQTFSSSSSSSSSYSSSGNGRPIVFGHVSTTSTNPSGTVSILNRFGDDGSSSTSSHSLPNGAVHYPMGSSNGYSDDYNNGQYDNNSNQYDNYDDNTNTGNYNKVPHYSSVSASSSLQSNGGPVVFKTEQSVTSNKAKANVQNRFGGDDTPQTVSKTVSTTGYIDEKGVVHSKTTTSKN
ncbi:probable ATP-dependent RNA helicase ddx42 isoform X1 [Bactrocera oleae]|uniref:probable ATP-dependent RNA helicase ddx42 isoform X1 n=1 Tax=Bactrocera oleae TaxID=104688 RepID=UPI0006B6EA34|nr:putative proline-rich receptor-like protein kinase PERK6 isoform X2 [Bactrocera oleae]XP_036212725.1 putative proline-rich receptor-like protein kinase PERK6 isoform X2 [Bactrocera oleae]XP_036212726.1 putative proline-rich receptor-like protein kinase PERK6 isoform X2 [Bactrocera oleae]